MTPTLDSPSPWTEMREVIKDERAEKAQKRYRKNAERARRDRCHSMILERATPWLECDFGTSIPSRYQVVRRFGWKNWSMAIILALCFAGTIGQALLRGWLR